MTEVKETSAVTLLSSEEIQSEIKPLSSNGFIAFFQKIYRAWLGYWYGFCDKHPKAGKLIGQFVVMFIFSNAVTVWQLLVMLFLPYAFIGLWETPFVWPAIALPWKDAMNNALNFAIFNEPVKFLNAANETILCSTAEAVAAAKAQAGNVLQCSGIGNFIAFEITVFTAQCINFPLQRNITFRSNGNPYYQALWYFIGWLGISIGVNALWGIMNPLMLWWNWPDALIALIKTIITGGISMLVFFPIFIIIFPDANKVAEKARAKADAVKASGADEETVAVAELKAVQKEEEARLFNARTERYKAISQANSSAVAYVSAVKNAEKAKAEIKDEETQATADAIEARIPDYQRKATEAIKAKREAIKAYELALEEVKSAKLARGENISKIK